MFKKIVNNILGSRPEINETQKDTKVLNQLMKQPPQEKGDDMPKFQNFQRNHTHQADLLFLPQDKTFKYLLVVVDESSRLVDAEPVKDKESAHIVKAFIKIYSRTILNKPKHIELDSGKEFKGDTSTYFKNLNITIRYAETNRHRQQGLVERANQKIGKIIFMLQNQKELQSKKQSKVWITYLREIIKELNNDSKTKNVEQKEAISEIPIITKNNYKMLNQDDKVRVLLDHPIDIYNSKRLGGTFRSGDIRYTIKVYKIKEVLMRPGFPPMYLTTKSKTTQYTKQQLQAV